MICKQPKNGAHFLLNVREGLHAQHSETTLGRILCPGHRVRLPTDGRRQTEGYSRTAKQQQVYFCSVVFT